VRQDKIASLRQRLHRGADAFEFQALIEGVSTLEEAEGTRGRGDAGINAQDEPRVDAVSPDLQDRTPDAIPAAAAIPVPASPRPRVPASEREERLRAALDALGGRLAQEVGRMGAAMQAGEIEEAGFYLAHVNQILELLRSIDPSGDLARQLGTSGAPPEGRAWPATAWSVVEFAESPLSALLPPDAGEPCVRNLLYAAWGVAFDKDEG
jgi:hypothetical protein